MYFIGKEHNEIMFIIEFDKIVRSGGGMPEDYVNIIDPLPIYRSDEVTDHELELFYEYGVSKKRIIDSDQDLIQGIFE